MLDRRLQILLDEDRYRRLQAEAKRRRTSVAQVVREAIDKALPADLARKRAALKEILEAEPMPVPEDPRDLKREIEEAHERRVR
ncbi:MAG TPA: ribbon-helix-helix protein, CopG family [Actinomycetota bacterium]|jgi:predicted CopG family antitoxin|nr:ribbon-helix-helix protein, CopG family [Actinomycetota bacterium]